jgi:hypothetical protein
VLVFYDTRLWKGWPAIDRLTDAQTIGLAMVILGVVFAVGWTVRGGIRVLRTLFIPSSIANSSTWDSGWPPSG